MSRTDDDSARRARICVEFGLGERFSIVRATILESVQYAIDTDDGDPVAVELDIQSTLRGERREATDVHPVFGSRGSHYIIPVCRRAASDIMD